ncbi:MAG: sodium:proton antiporter [Ruminococcaceae bacterium]|nr:sodium:proton antiporter [Oscillospiraceae bacterium]
MLEIYRILEIAALVLLSVGMFLALIRAIRGPRIADRIIGANMAGTLTIMAIAILADVLKQDWLLDVCLIYCMISFLAVVVLSKIYITVHLERKKRNAQKEDA